MSQPLRAQWLRRAPLADIARYRDGLRAAIAAIEAGPLRPGPLPLPASVIDRGNAFLLALRRAAVAIEERLAAPDGWPPTGGAK